MWQPGVRSVSLFAIESLQHFLLECPAYKNISDQSFQEIVDNMHVFMPCLDFTEWSPLQKLQFLIGFMVYGVLRHIQQYFSYIVAVSFIGGGNRSTAENHRPVTSHWQTLSHNVASNTARYERGSNSQL